MRADELRALQGPLKERYRTNPETAKVTLSAGGRVEDDVACAVEGLQGTIRAGLHPAAGGDGSLACSGDMLLQALVACSGVTMAAVATALGIDIGEAEIRAEGELDFRGTLGVAKDVPVGFGRIRLIVRLETDASAEQIATLLKLTERYCVIYQTLRQPPVLELERRV